MLAGVVGLPVAVVGTVASSRHRLPSRWERERQSSASLGGRRRVPSVSPSTVGGEFLPECTLLPCSCEAVPSESSVCLGPVLYEHDGSADGLWVSPPSCRRAKCEYPAVQGYDCPEGGGLEFDRRGYPSPRRVSRRSCSGVPSAGRRQPSPKSAVGVSSPLSPSSATVTWLILPVVICLSQRLSHACPSMNASYCETANGSLNQL